MTIGRIEEVISVDLTSLKASNTEDTLQGVADLEYIKETIGQHAAYGDVALHRLQTLLYLIQHLRQVVIVTSPFEVQQYRVFSWQAHHAIGHLVAEGTADLVHTTVAAGATTAIFATDVTGAGVITNKTYEADTVPANKILLTANSDNDSIYLHFELEGGPSGWLPDSIVVSGGSSDLTALKANYADSADVSPPNQGVELAVTDTNDRRWTGKIKVDATASNTLLLTVSDGAVSGGVTYVRELDPPVVLTAAFDTHAGSTGGDPLVQGAQVATTSVSGGTQTLRITGTTEAHATHVRVKSAGVSSSLQGPFTVTAGAFDFTINVRSSGNTGLQNATLYATEGSVGTPGPDKLTSNQVTISHTVPTFGSFSVAYPVSQEAIKGAETCDVTLAHTNIAAGDDYLYTPVGISIPSTTTYASPKTGVTRGTVGYKESGNNFTLAVTRTTQNGATGSSAGVVKVAHDTAIVTVSEPLSRLGSGASTLDHTITITSTQANLSTHTPTLAQGAGDTSTFQGSWVASGVLAYTRALRVADADIKAGGQAANDYSWGACSVKNRANTEVTVVTAPTGYSLGGFTTRTINILSGAHTKAIGVPIVNTSKTTVSNQSKGGTPVQAYEGSVVEHNDADSSLNNFWTTVASVGSESFDDFTEFFHCSDKRFYDAVTTSFNIDIAEAV